jgi:heme A synthase
MWYFITDLAKLDLILFILFGTISLAALAGAIWCFRKALKVSSEKDGDLKMFWWALWAMLGLIISGMSAAYILLPIIFHR